MARPHFDIYGTLIDTQGIKYQLSKIIGEQADSFAKAWREKQLEYSFRRGLMQNYQDFATCTAQALDYTCQSNRVNISDIQKQQLLNGYQQLPAFDDVQSILKDLVQLDTRLFAFSNGSESAVRDLLENAQLIDYFEAIVSVDDIKSFKPNPATYSHFLRQANAKGNNSYLISSNSFDVLGALSHGMQAIWLNRNNQNILDPWEMTPTATITSLTQLPQALNLQP